MSEIFPLFCILQLNVRNKIKYDLIIAYISIILNAILYSHSVDPRKLCVGVKYYIVHMYSMPYYTYGSTANVLVLGPTVLIYISKERRCNEDLHSVGNLKIERVFR